MKAQMSRAGMVGEGVWHRTIRAMYHTLQRQTQKIYLSLVGGFLIATGFRGLSGSTAPGHDKHELKVTVGLIKAVDSRQHRSGAEAYIVWQVHRQNNERIGGVPEIGCEREVVCRGRPGNQEETPILTRFPYLGLEAQRIAS